MLLRGLVGLEPGDGSLQLDEVGHELVDGRDGELVFWAGGIGVHALDVAFLRRVAEDAETLLPYHASPKKIPTVDAEGSPASVMGRKFETFIFDAIPESAVASYVASGEGRDKAGAYAVQGLASGFVTRIEGSYTNVVGLPAAEVVSMLLGHGAIGSWP